MATPPRNLGISFGELHHFHDGLGEFSLQFGRQIAERSAALASAHNIRVYFHLPEQWHGYFGDQVQYLPLTDRQRYWHAPGVRFDVWHNLHQHIRQRPPLRTRHVITTLHDLNMAYMKRGGSRWRALRRQASLLKRADEIVCISDYVLSDLRRHTKVRQPALRIYNGVRQLQDLQQDAPPLPFSGPFFFHIGRMAPNKNVHRLVDLAAHWPERQFVLAGPRSGYTEGHLRAAEAMGLRNVHMLFDVTDEQKAWLYAHCNGLIFPSSTEGFGLPPIEAMSFGKPVFLSRATCLPEIGGDLACYFDNLAPAAMQQVILQGEVRLQGIPEVALRIQEWAGRFSWSTCIDNYLSRYLAAMQEG